MKEEPKDGISRRKFVQAGGMIAATAIIPKEINRSVDATDEQNHAKSEEDYLQYIDPIIGNIAPLLNTNRPVVHLPNQMVRTFPRRQDYTDDQITGFPLLALNIITPQVIFSIKPSKGVITDTDWNGRMTYDHDLEITRPWYYATTLIDEDIRVEHTVGKNGGIYRFTFPKGVKKNILLNHCYENGIFTITNGNKISGTEFVIDAIHQQKGKAYMYGIFSGKPISGKSAGEKDWGKYNAGGPKPKPKTMAGEKAWMSYSENEPSVIEFRYATSFISEEQAEKNYNEELLTITFQQLADKSKAAWKKVIGQIKVEGGTVGQKRTFYTALYRCYARMINITEDGKYFSAYDGQVHEDKRPFYTDDYSWGNFIAMHPLRTILDPKAEGDMLQSYVIVYQQSGWVPEYPKTFGDREGMLSFHSSIMFLDAYRKGIRNFDANKALEGMLKSAEQATMLPSRNGPKGALEDFYYEKGYYPALHPGEAETDPIARHGQRSAVAVTLAGSYDAWALSEMAKELGNTPVYNRHAPRANNYKNLWNKEAMLFLPKDAKGDWININPKTEGGAYYNENNGLTYKWNIQHDVEGVIALMGGKEKFEQELDQFFRDGLESNRASFLAKFQDMTALTGQFSMGNQCAFYIPYLYNYTNSPWKTQKWTRYVLDTWFKDNVLGVPGDEDGGSMSAVVVFSAMGFFPVKPGVPMYTITSPVFSKITIDLPNGKMFTLIANGCSKTHKYIQSAKMNGKKLDTLWFSHSDLVNGGTLVLEMGEMPLKA
ncbi:GH92 family glycosyl hydrolase [Mucilaginibacter sp.]|uniref:GH92 family glycosyl hydrolase n=1 Tax=Mucilaginibacter sp. TaxID=1882438 RepID=UPI00261AE664|nr:GH92 family glycosyl hydrolase [Mucilaginibacter sp.]MDB4927252.1 alpha-mannosidase [Mucilaginibacter sp.]